MCALLLDHLIRSPHLFEPDHKAYIAALSVFTRPTAMPILQQLTLGLVLSACAHTLAFVLYNRYRRTQLLHYVQLCRGQELSEQDWANLMETYSSFLGFAMPAPSRSDYPKLYTNPAFEGFARRSKRTMIYLATGLVLSYVLAILLDPLQH